LRTVTSPYRSEVDALRERKETLEQELSRIRDEAAHLAGLRVRQEELERELAVVAQKLGASERRTLPLLDDVRVASPCSASWDEMLGDDRVRYCLSCEKSVYNLSAMPRVDAEALLRERASTSELCVRFYRRADGTVMTADCPVGVKKKRRKKLALAVAGAGAMALAATGMARSSTCRSGFVQGDVPAMPVAMGTTSPPTVTAPLPDEPAEKETLGQAVSPSPAAPMMGKRAVVGRMPALRKPAEDGRGH
jgi:hypothetical protein